MHYEGDDRKLSSQEKVFKLADGCIFNTQFNHPPRRYNHWIYGNKFLRFAGELLSLESLSCNSGALLGSPSLQRFISDPWRWIRSASHCSASHRARGAEVSQNGSRKASADGIELWTAFWSQNEDRKWRYLRTLSLQLINLWTKNEKKTKGSWRIQRMEVERRSLKVQPLYLYSVESERLTSLLSRLFGELELGVHNGLTWDTSSQQLCNVHSSSWLAAAVVQVSKPVWNSRH